jgi:hypothetical protein
VLAFLAVSKNATMQRVISDEPLLLDGLALVDDGRLSLVASSLQPRSSEVCLGPLPDGEVSIRRLNEATMDDACFHPQAFRGSARAVTNRDGEVHLSLLPYETVFLEVRRSQV